MSMNLIQIQDKLKSLPNDPRVMQMLTAYANGQSPQVPPYLALGELNRRKGEMERMKMEQAGQPPGGTVKDQIQQQAGVMALKQGQQQQAMQRMAQQGMQGGAPVPQGTPQPQVQAAAGGLASLAPKAYRSGGIIAFKKAGSVDAAVEEDENEDGESTEDLPNIEAQLAKALSQIDAQQKAKPPTVASYADVRKRMAEADPERYGILNTPIGKGSLERLEGLQSARRAELAKQKEELAQSKPGILQLLGQAAMGSRGQQGGSALASILGGYSDLSTTAGAKQLQQEQALRMKELDLQQAKAEAMNKVDELLRARADGDVAKEQQLGLDIAKMAKELGVSVNTLLGRKVTALGSIAGRERAANITGKAKIAAAKVAGNKPEKLTDLGGLTKAHMDALVAGGADAADPQVKLLASQRAARDLSKSAGSYRAEVDAIDKANTAFQNETLAQGRELRKLRNEDPVGYNLRLEALRSNIEKRYKVRPDADAVIGGSTASPEAAKPAAPSAKPTAKPATGITPAEFDKQWAKLKPGQSLVGPDGETYTKK